MKKIWIILLALTLVISMVACSSSADDTVSETYEFKGEVISLEGTGALLQVAEGEAILSSGDQVSIFIGETGKDQIKVGDNLIVEYDGGVMESYPLQVMEISIRKEDGTVIDIVKNGSNTSDSPDAVASAAHFEAIVVEVVEGGYIVRPVDGSDELNSSNRIIVYTDQTFDLENKVSIIYDGEIMESDPAQINHSSIELVE